MKCEDGEIESYNFDDAVKRFKNVEYANYKDWRLPTIDELKTLVYCSNGVKNKDSGKCNDNSEKPTINQQAFSNTPKTIYWSGSPDADNSNYAWYVDFNLGYFGSGGSYLHYRSMSKVARLVRGGQ